MRSDSTRAHGPCNLPRGSYQRRRIACQSVRRHSYLTSLRGGRGETDTDPFTVRRATSSPRFGDLVSASGTERVGIGGGIGVGRMDGFMWRVWSFGAWYACVVVRGEEDEGR